MNKVWSILENVKTAFAALGSGRMRSLLTILGIVIGIAAMTAVTSLLQGFNSEVNSTFEEMGTSTIYVRKLQGASMAGGSGRAQNTRPDLELWYIDELLEVEGVSGAVPVSTTMGSVKTLDGIELSVELRGTLFNWPDVAGREVATGRFFTEYEGLSGTSVCVIGQTVSERLFGSDDPSGSDIQVDGRTLVVIGVMEEQGEMMGQDQDNMILIPSSIFSRWGSLEGNLTLMVTADSPETMNGTQSRIESCLRQLRGLSIDEDNNFELITADNLKEGFSTVSTWLFIGLIGLSSISLFVGSVGIANIMLVSVAQRTGEIGLRKALGATKQMILGQFITESIILSLTGGILGIISGIGLAQLMASLTGLSTGLSVAGVGAGVLVSTLAGTLAGLYPAARAAGMQPVTALSHSI